VVTPGHSAPQTITLGGYRRLTATQTAGAAPQYSSVKYIDPNYVMPKLRHRIDVDSTWKSKVKMPRARVNGPMVPTPSRDDNVAVLGQRKCRSNGPYKFGFYRPDKRLAMRQAESIKSAMYKNCRLFEVPVKATHLLHLILHKLIRVAVDRGLSNQDYRNICRVRQVATFSSSHAEAIGKALLCKCVPRNDWRLPLSGPRRPFYDPGKSRRTYRKLRKRHKGLSKSYFDPLHAPDYESKAEFDRLFDQMQDDGSSSSD